MRTSNPALRESLFQQTGSMQSGTMTIDGSVQKTGILLALLVITAGWVWSIAFETTGYGETALMNNPGIVTPYMIGGSIGGLICALILMFKQTWAPYLAPAYAVLQGAAIGGISSYFELRFPGIALQAAGLTFGVLFSLLFCYKARIIKVTEKFRTGVIIATAGIALIYFVSWIMSFFGTMTFVHSNSTMGIGFSLVVVGIAAMNLLLDFDLIEKAAQQRQPKYMEWYGAFALMVTLVWLYLEILRLLAKFNSKDR